MSTIVAVEKNGHAAVACDTMFAVGSIRSVNAARTKALRVGESVIAVAGFSVYFNILEHYFAESDTVPALQDEIAVFDFFLHFWRVLHDRYTYVNDQSDSGHPSPFADLDAEFLVVNPAGIFEVKEILSVSQHKRFCAIGSGNEHAEGALQILYDGDRSVSDIAKQAVLVAMEFDRASGGTVETYEIPSKGK